jgi:cytidylate kinase
MDAGIHERQQRRAAEGVQENLAARDHLDQSRTMNPLVVPDGACLVNTSGMTPEQSSEFLLQSIQHIQKSLTNPNYE